MCVCARVAMCSYIYIYAKEVVVIVCIHVYIYIKRKHICAWTSNVIIICML